MTVVPQPNPATPVAGPRMAAAAAGQWVTSPLASTASPVRRRSTRIRGAGGVVPRASRTRLRLGPIRWTAPPGTLVRERSRGRVPARRVVTPGAAPRVRRGVWRGVGARGSTALRVSRGPRRFAARRAVVAGEGPRGSWTGRVGCSRGVVRTPPRTGSKGPLEGVVPVLLQRGRRPGGGRCGQDRPRGPAGRSSRSRSCAENGVIGKRGSVAGRAEEGGAEGLGGLVREGEDGVVQA